MSGSTWTWTGATDSAWTTTSNWLPASVPTAGSTVDINSNTGTILTLTGTELNNNTVNLSNGATIDFASGSTLDGLSTISGPNGTIAAPSGVFTDYGNIAAYSGDTLVVEMGSTSTLVSNGAAYSGPGTDVGINNGAAGYDNGGTLLVLGGTLDNQEIHVNGGYTEVTSALEANDELSLDNGTLELDLQSTTSPSQITFINAATSVPSILKFDNSHYFDGDGAGTIYAFMTGDTIDIGAQSIGTIIFDADSSVGGGTLVAENPMGSVLLTAVLSGGDAGNFSSGTFAVSGTTAGSFQVTTGGNGDTLISELGSPVIISSNPTITAGASANYTEGGNAVALDTGIVITDPESTTIDSATVAITAGFASGDILAMGAVDPNVTANYNGTTGVLTLTGAASLSEYEQDLDSVTYASSGDPTVGGTDDSRTITWAINDGTTTATANSSLAVAATIVPSSGPGDLILLQNSNGQAGLWDVTGDTLTAASDVGPNPGSSWYAVAKGAFFTGDTSDILWQNANGQIGVWQVQNGTLGSYGTVGPNPGTSWHVVGTGNFYTTDTNTDLVLQNSNGEVGLWDINGTNLVQYGEIANPGTSWKVEGTGNFYGTGDNTILLQNSNGQVGMWEMNGTTLEATGVVSANPGPSWMIKGTGDFYGDGNTDILWQNSNGEVAIWDMVNGTTIEQSAVIANPGTSWNVVGTGDFNNDGKTDIVLQNSNGQVAVWDMNGSTIEAAGIVANATTSWSVVDNTMRFIYSESAGETLAATPAAPDEFVFDNYAAGMHTITGFDPTQDVIAFSSSQFPNISDVEAATSATAAGAMINLGNGSSLLVAGITPSALQASNFSLT